MKMAKKIEQYFFIYVLRIQGKLHKTSLYSLKYYTMKNGQDFLGI